MRKEEVNRMNEIGYGFRVGGSADNLEQVITFMPSKSRERVGLKPLDSAYKELDTAEVSGGFVDLVDSWSTASEDDAGLQADLWASQSVDSIPGPLLLHCRCASGPLGI